MTKRPKYTLSNAFIKSSSIYTTICFYLLIASLLLACASNLPSESLPQSKVAVSSIDHPNYRMHVSSDIDAVKAMLKQALELEANNQHEPTEQLAQKIIVDVELIQIKTQRLSVEKEVKQIENSIFILNQELKWREPVQLAPLNQ